ncbi:MAG: 16S rRNA (uracil(1498)-N(3))-methyltransferase [Bacteroidales bacterium]|nr:16S rRNA (uracil(1498)-N(3))-methyltransferase [Bacteroidales bacterium]
MQLFYSPDITPSALCTLDPEESRHAVRVLRMRQGDPIDVTDGRGALHHCTIVEASEKGCVVQPLTSDLRPPTSDLHLAVAPTKNPSRMEWLVEKAVEMGVGDITLLRCDRSERSFLKTERLQKLAVSAMKQSLRTLLPAIGEAVVLRDWLHSKFKIQNSELKFIAHCEAGQPRTPLADLLEPGRPATILIGPEGDFSAEEIALALELGFRSVSLGPSRLRTETAALYAVAAFNLINDRTL